VCLLSSSGKKSLRKAEESELIRPLGVARTKEGGGYAKIGK